MKYIKLYEELKKSTYISAAKKLREMGGIKKQKRAERLEDHAIKNGEEYDIHNFHYHEFKINGNSGYLIAADDQGIFYKARRERSRLYLTLFMYDTRRDKKSISIEFTYYGANGWAINYGEHEKVSCIDDGVLEMYLNYYEDGKYVDCEPFLFENRKDAIEFKNFIMDNFSEYTEEIDALSKVTINQMIE